MNTDYEPHQYEYTCILSNGDVVHYTCNPPSKDVLKKNGITPLDGLNGGNSVYVIPANVFRKLGYQVNPSIDNNVLKITAENLMRRL
jgi:hypothetical protein